MIWSPAWYEGISGVLLYAKAQVIMLFWPLNSWFSPKELGNEFDSLSDDPHVLHLLSPAQLLLDVNTDKLAGKTVPSAEKLRFGRRDMRVKPQGDCKEKAQFNLSEKQYFQLHLSVFYNQHSSCHEISAFHLPCTGIRQWSVPLWSHLRSVISTIPRVSRLNGRPWTSVRHSAMIDYSGNRENE